ncbi:MAG: hypothetical protein UR43_C0010G0028 [candidate division TM6 bacterium GW2011_GWF2_33_332]|nr:MAG: hypothetical protein UR43_C0010G0028 [candidate division TM6 bacterium GW2011_GWF2_33_332]
MTKKYLNILLTLLPFWNFGQTWTEKLILTDTKDSTILKAESINFDSKGDYLIEMKNDDNEYFFIRSSDTLGPLKFNWGSTVSKYTSIDNPAFSYYQSYTHRLFGPIEGTDIGNHNYPQSKNSLHFSIPCLLNNKIVIYFDGKIIQQTDTISGLEWSINGKKASPLQAKKQHFSSENWMNISDNGNYIYSIEDNLIYKLYLNGTPIDSSMKDFYQVRVNDNGDYLYAKGRKPFEDEPYKYSYMFFLHTKDSVFGPVRTAWDCFLMENGAYYYKGDDDGPDYILINDVMYKNINDVSNVTLLDKKNYLFTYYGNEKLFVNVNGNSYELDYEQIFYPTLDDKGNFALFGLRDYYLYKFVNGKEVKEPISRYGVRPTPLYISPTGESIHVFRTDDSTYIYRDEKLLFPSFASQKSFSIIQQKDILSSAYEKGKPENGNSLFYIEVDSTGYLVFNGQFSNPMIPVQEKSWRSGNSIGEVVSGQLMNGGFYIIQKTGDAKWLININNTTYKELDDTTNLFYRNCYFDGKELVFYGVKGLSIYQFKIAI